LERGAGRNLFTKRRLPANIHLNAYWYEIMAVRVTDNTFKAIERVRATGRCNMIDWRCVHAVLVELGEEIAADWLESNVSAYLMGISQGFEVEKDHRGFLH
jgi:hypothetical protein